MRGKIVVTLALFASLEAASLTSVARPATPDPGRRVAAALLSAATTNDAKTLWSLLSKPSQRRLGPTFKAFESAGARRIERALRPFERPSVKLFISQNVTTRFGVVAMRLGARALAFPLRREQKAWKIETPGPLAIRILGPEPGSRGRVSQVAFEARAPGPIRDAIVFVDGRLYRPRLAYAGTKRIATVFVSLPKPLARGMHIAVAYADQGSNVSAEAWAFSAS